MQKNNKKSLLTLITAMIIFGSIGVFRKYIPLPSSVLACFRGFAGAALLVLIAKLQKRKLFYPIGKKRLVWLIISGAVMGFNWILLFEAYNYTTVATATLCYYMEPTIMVVLSPFLFQEPLTLKKGLCALASVIGMMLVSGIVETGLPSMEQARGILYGLGAAVLYAIVVIINKKIPGVDAYQKTIIQLLSAAIVLVPYVLLTGQAADMQITAVGIVLLFVVGIVHTGISYAMYFGSMDGLRAQTIALISYLDPVTALLLSALILGEQLTVYGIIGALLIIGAAIISEIQFGRRQKHTL